jgi:hypothetical protein
MSIPFSTDYYSTTTPGSNNTIFLAINCPPSVGGVMTGYFDMVQCYGGEDNSTAYWRPLGDLNGDYVADYDDNDMVAALYYGYSQFAAYKAAHPTVPDDQNPYYVYQVLGCYVDYTRNGAADNSDETIWTASVKGETRKVDDFKRTGQDYR